MRVIGTINAGVSKTGYVAYVHCPVGVTQHDRRYNLIATLLSKVERFIYFKASLAILQDDIWTMDASVLSARGIATLHTRNISRNIPATFLFANACDDSIGANMLCLGR